MDYVNGDALVTVEWLKEHPLQRSVGGSAGRHFAPATTTDAMATQSSWTSTSRGRCDSTSIRFPTSQIHCHTCCLAPNSLANPSALWASATSTVSWSTMYTDCRAPPEPGGCSAFGHSNVAVLHGGLPAWEAAVATRLKAAYTTFVRRFCRSVERRPRAER